MAKSIKKIEEERANKNWKEGEMIRTFNLKRIFDEPTPLMEEWLEIEMPELNSHEQYIFDKSLSKVKKSFSGWNEEDLKIKFIGPILELGYMIDDEIVIGYFDKTISAVVENIKLTVKSDFMLAKGTLEFFETPYFHFQEYKPYKNPSGDSMAQLLEAFLIAQEKNKNGLPLYGVDIMGKQWSFVTMEGKSYCISKTYDAADKEDLMSIVAILRKFKYILETRLLDKVN
jgi:hypothetical protein